MNAESSRSHLVVSLLLKTIDKTSNAEITGKITLVDLAGSERQKKTGATGQQVKEANSITKSLSALSNVIAALVKEDSKHVPYRTNILTMLMSDSIGGNAKAQMFVNLSPADYNLAETENSLMYASRKRSTMPAPRIQSW